MMHKAVLDMHTINNDNLSTENKFSSAFVHSDEFYDSEEESDFGLVNFIRILYNRRDDRQGDT